MLVYVAVIGADYRSVSVVADASADDDRSTEQVHFHSRLASADFYDFVTVIFEVYLEEDVGDEALEVVVVLNSDAGDVDYRW